MVGSFEGARAESFATVTDQSEPQRPQKGGRRLHDYIVLSCVTGRLNRTDFGIEAWTKIGVVEETTQPRDKDICEHPKPR